MISFFAYHGDAELRQRTINRVASFAQNGAVRACAEAAPDRTCLVSVLADGDFDLATAHSNSGFPAPLLRAAAAVCDGLPAEEAPRFALALVRSAAIDTDLGPVVGQFVDWLFADAVVAQGAARLRATAREAGPIFRRLVDDAAPTAAQQRKAKALAKTAKRRGLGEQDPDVRLVDLAVEASLDEGGKHVGAAVGWISNLSPTPIERYRRYAKKLLELVETA